ncbi:50S ribosomal protein L33 [Anaplasmataceae bacterium AB001_6]|nr:50S ribosomal protein L33 [Anaplasmataceae bacterium AB001_6]
MSKVKKNKTLYKLVSSENSDCFYVVSLNAKTINKSWTIRKFDRKARKHVIFKLKKL